MPDRTRLSFASADNRLVATLEADVVRTMTTCCAGTGRRETGGILIGNYDRPGRVASIVEATRKPKDSLSGWFWFQRGTAGLKELLAERWKQGFYYLGEWHHHPGGSPEPSLPDVKAMSEIASNPKYNCTNPILVILGGDPGGRFQLSVTANPLSNVPIRLLQCEGLISVPGSSL